MLLFVDLWRNGLGGPWGRLCDLEILEEMEGNVGNVIGKSDLQDPKRLNIKIPAELLTDGMYWPPVVIYSCKRRHHRPNLTKQKRHGPLTRAFLLLASSLYPINAKTDIYDCVFVRPGCRPSMAR